MEAEYELVKRCFEQEKEKGEMLRNHSRFDERIIADKIDKSTQNINTNICNKGHAIMQFRKISDEDFAVNFVGYCKDVQHYQKGYDDSFMTFAIEYNKPVYFHVSTGPEQCPLENHTLVSKIFSMYIDHMNGKIDVFKERLDKRDSTGLNDLLVPNDEAEASVHQNTHVIEEINTTTSYFIVAVVPNIVTTADSGNIGYISFSGPVVISVLAAFDEEEQAERHAVQLSEENYRDIDLYVVRSGWVSPSDLGRSSNNIKTMYTQSRAMQEIHSSFRDKLV